MELPVLDQGIFPDEGLDLSPCTGSGFLPLSPQGAIKAMAAQH